MADFTYMTLFSGIGMADIGYREAFGVEPIIGVEKDPSPASLYRCNFPHTNLYEGDVWDMLSSYNHLKGMIALLHASPPCQDFSPVNPNRQLEDDLGVNVIHAMDRIKPLVLVLENVPNYVNSQVFKRIIDEVEPDYHIWYDLIDFHNHGLPSYRKRVILIAVRRDYHDRPLKFEPPTVENKGWYEAVKDLLPSCEPVTLADWQLKRVKDNLPLEDGWFMLCRQGGNVKTAKPRIWSEPSFTVRAFANDPHTHLFDCFRLEDGQVMEARKLNLKGIARLMGLPDTYDLSTVTEAKAIAGIGNGLPSCITKLIGQTVLEQLDEAPRFDTVPFVLPPAFDNVRASYTLDNVNGRKRRRLERRV